MHLDTYWVQAAGGDPAKWIKKLSGRLECVHLKDMAYIDKQRRFAPVYEGNMNFDAIIQACAEAKTEYLLVEQDDCYGQDLFECLRVSYENLKSKGL
ncbi:MAG: Xylose isomerase domain protein barrel [Oscillospiraceae bacterium]|nr:Xylose isomerase domain protein barrel [Oscillospiraceae bacterium]